MIFINKQIKNLKPSATLAINQKVKELRAAKKEVYHFGFGQSPFPIHPRIINKLVHNAGNNHYLPTMGLESLRKQIAEFLTSYHKVPTAMDNVLVGPGSKELLFQTILILEGRFLIPKGSWVSYGPQIKSKGVQYDVLDTKLEDNFKLTPDILEAYCEAYPDEQKTLILNSPNNPTGAVYSSDELIGLSKVCRTYSVIILSDEIYALINFYQNTSPSMAEYYPERTFVFGGLSKIFSAGGYRLGFVRLPSEFNELSNTFRSLFSETFSAVASPVQFSAIEAFRMPKEIEYCINVNNTVLKLIAEYVHEKLSKFGIECTIPQGAFYLMIGFNKFKTKIKDKLNIDNSADLAIYILDNYNVALLPGLDFYFKPEDLFFRLAYVDFDGKNLIESNDL
jgi:aspartate aminotransferase